MRLNRYLIYSVSQQNFRVVTRTPRLMVDEVAWRLHVTLPDSLGRFLGDIDITLPDVAPEVEVTEAQLPSGSHD